MAAEAIFSISAFGDEIAADLEEQIQVLQDLDIHFLEFRGAWDKNVLHLNDAEVTRVGRACAGSGISVSCIGSPVGKSPIEAPLSGELRNLSRAFEIGERLGCFSVRIFSFYPPESGDKPAHDDYLPEATDRLRALTELAQNAGFCLLLENEKGIVGDTIDRCHALLRAIDSPHLRFIWDPANFVQVGEKEPTTRGWATLGTYTAHVHVKDAHLSDGSVCPAGEGDGQVGALLARLQDAGYQGLLALEPHLTLAGPRGGFSGPEGMRRAAQALRALLSKQGLEET
jgi:sugar phosphate isomerase/epimerase